MMGIQRLNTNLLLVVCLLLSIACGGPHIPGAMVDVSLQLQPEQDGDGDLYADIFLDGVVVASVRNGDSTDFEVPAGDHELRLELNGYRSVTKKIKVLDTIRQNIHFTLASD